MVCLGWMRIVAEKPCGTARTKARRGSVGGAQGWEEKVGEREVQAGRLIACVCRSRRTMRWMTLPWNLQATWTAGAFGLPRLARSRDATTHDQIYPIGGYPSGSGRPRGTSAVSFTAAYGKVADSSLVCSHVRAQQLTLGTCLLLAFVLHVIKKSVPNNHLLSILFQPKTIFQLPRLAVSASKKAKIFVFMWYQKVRVPEVRFSGTA